MLYNLYRLINLWQIQSQLRQNIEVKALINIKFHISAILTKLYLRISVIKVKKSSFLIFGNHRILFINFFIYITYIMQMQSIKTRNFRLKKFDLSPIPGNEAHKQRINSLGGVESDKQQKLFTIIHEVLHRFSESEDFSHAEQSKIYPSDNINKLNGPLIIRNQKDSSKRFSRQHHQRLDVRDKAIQIPFHFEYSSEYMAIFKSLQCYVVQSQLMDNIISKIEEYLVYMVQTIISVSFNELLQGKLKENQSKDYASKNILFNVHSICKETFKALKQHNLTNGQQKSIQILLVESIELSLKEILFNLAPYYPQTQPTGVTPKMRECLLAIDRSDNSQLDFLRTQNIKLQKQQNGNYTGYIMAVLNRAIQVTGEIDNEHENNLTFFEQYTQFIQNLSWIIKQDSYSKIISNLQVLSKNKSPQSTLLSKADSMKETVPNEKKSLEEIKDNIKQFFQHTKIEKINSLLNHANRQNLMTEQKKYKKIIDMRKNHQFQIGQKLPNRLKPFNQKDMKNNHFTAKHSSILRILTKWAEKLQDIFDFAESYILQSHYPFTTLSGKSIYPSQALKKQIFTQINNLKTRKDAIKHQLKQKNIQIQSQFLTEDIKNFNQVSRFIKRYTETRITASKMNALIVELMKQYVSDLINLLILAGKYSNSDTNRNEPEYIDLIAFRIGDLMRSRIYINQSSFIKLLKTLYILDEKERREKPFFELIRIKNKLDTKDNNILINFLFKGKVQCEIQVLTQKISGKTESYYTYSHYLYEMMRGSFGVLSECAIIISQHDPIASFNPQELYYNPKLKQRLLKKKSSVESKIEDDIKQIFICIRCKKLIHNENISFFNIDVKNICQSCIKQAITKNNLKQLLPNQSTQLDNRSKEKYSLQAFLSNSQSQNIIDLIESGQIKRISNHSSLQEIKVLMLIFSIDKKKNEIISNLIIYDQIQLEWYNTLLTQQLMTDDKYDDQDIQIVNISKKIFNRKAIDQITYVELSFNKVNMVQILKLFKIFPAEVNLLNKICQIQQKIKTIIYKKSIQKQFKNKTQVMVFNKNALQLQYLNSMIKDADDVSHIQYVYAQELKLEKIPFWLQFGTNLKLLNLNKNTINDVSLLYNLKNLKEVYLSQNALKEIVTTNWPKLQTLDASNNNLRGIGSSEMASLQYLNLSSNYISAIDVAFFPNLVELNLNKNFIPQLYLAKMSHKIQKLQLRLNLLSHQKLDKFPDSLLQLDLNGNGNIKQIKNEILPKNLVILKASQCDLSAFSITNMTKLKILQLDNNKGLKDIKIKNAPCLQDFSAAGCRLQNLQNIEFSKQISKIMCGRNKIQQLELNNLPNIDTLSLDQNKIKRLKLNNVNIGILNLIDNEIRNLQEIDIPKGVKRIFLKENRLTKCTFRNYPHLKILNLENNLLSQLDIDDTPSLTQLALDINRFTNCDHLFLPNQLESLFLRSNQFQSFNLENMPGLKNLILDKNPLKKICLRNMPMLEQVGLLDTQISEIGHMQMPTTITKIFLSRNKLPQIDFIDMKNLTTIVMQTNQLTKSNLENLAQLVEVYMDANQLKEFTLKNVPKIQIISLSINKLQKLNFKQLPFLKTLNVTNNLLPELHLEQAPLIVTIEASFNKIKNISLKNLPMLTKVNLNNNQLVRAQFQNLPKLNQILVENNYIQTFSVVSLKNLKSINITNNPIVHGQFKELKSLESLTFYGSKMTSLNLQNLPSLSYLSSSSGQLTQIHLQNMPSLQTINVDDNKITRYQFINLPKLKTMRACNNQIEGVDSECFGGKLQQLNFTGNKIKGVINISNLSNLVGIYLANNMISSITLNNLQSLQELHLSNNLITEFNFDGIDHLINLDIKKNKIEHIDFNKLKEIESLTMNQCHFKSIHLSNLPRLNYITAMNCPHLQALTIENCLDLTNISISQNPNLKSLRFKDLQKLSYIVMSQVVLQILEMQNVAEDYAINFVCQLAMKEFILTKRQRSIFQVDYSHEEYNRGEQQAQNAPDVEENAS